MNFIRHNLLSINFTFIPSLYNNSYSRDDLLLCYTPCILTNVFLWFCFSNLFVFYNALEFAIKLQRKIKVVKSLNSNDNNISLSGCNMPRVKNAEFNGGQLMSWESMQCKTGYRYMTSLTCTERGLDKNATEFRCCKYIQNTRCWSSFFRYISIQHRE